MAEVRLIDANAAARNTDKEIYWTESEAAAVRNFLAHQPTIDPESLRPTGRKERSAISETGLMCTNCYSDVDLDAVFCKYCGAKMNTAE